MKNKQEKENYLWSGIVKKERPVHAISLKLEPNLPPEECKKRFLSSKPHDFEIIGSYNWLSSCDRCLALVPGSPPLVNNKWQGGQLKLSNNYFSDENYYRTPTNPLEVLFRSLPSMSLLNGVDLVTDRGNLRKIFSLTWGGDRPFRINVERSGEKLVCFSRVEDSGRIDQKSYGHSFEEACVKYFGEFKDYINSYRVLQNCKINEMNICIRCEVDYCYDNGTNFFDNKQSSEEVSPVSNYSLRTMYKDYKSHTTKNFEILRNQDETSLHSYHMGEMKTTSVANAGVLPLGDIYFQCLLSDVSQFMLGIHKRGCFLKPKTFSLAELEDKAFQHFPGLYQCYYRFVKILEEILEWAQKLDKNAPYALIFDGRKMECFKDSRQGTYLPRDLMGFDLNTFD